MSLVLFKKPCHALVFVWLLTVVACACHTELKVISEQVTISCSSFQINDPVTWWFNNASQIDSNFSSVTVSQDGRSIVISPWDVSVYGDYSCRFANGTLINCYSVYIQGIYNLFSFIFYCWNSLQS